MKAFRLVAFMLVFSVLPLPLLATTSVLLPEDSKDDTQASSPYLPRGSYSSDTPSQTAPMTRKGPTLEETVLGTAKSKRRGIGHKQFLANVNEIIEAHKEASARDPLILEEIIPPDFDDPDATTILRVRFDKDPLWGKKELKQINRALGYAEDEAVKNCQIRLVIKPKTKSGKFFLDKKVLPEGEVIVKHDGNLKEVVLRPQALCLTPKTLPRTGLPLTRINDKIMGVNLTSSLTCTPNIGNREPSMLAVKYKGDSVGLCVFH